MFPKQPGIYLLRWESNSYVYVGQATSIHKRRIRHLADLRNNHHYNQHLQRVFNKYGDPDVWVLDLCSVEDLNFYEDFWIHSLRALLGAEWVCNQQLYPGFARRGIKDSPETRALKSKARKGIPMTPEAKLRLSESKMGKPLHLSDLEKASRAVRGRRSLEARRSNPHPQAIKCQNCNTSLLNQVSWKFCSKKCSLAFHARAYRKRLKEVANGLIS